MENKFELMKFEDGEFSLDVNVSLNEDTVWLTLDEIGLLYGRDRSVISRHIKQIYLENLIDESISCAKIARKINNQIYHTKYYNLDVINIVGDRIKSKRCFIFKKWANEILKSKKGITKPLILFKHGDISLDVTVSPDEDTVWLSQNDMALLFDTTKQNISLHIKNILNDDELDNSVVKDFFTTAMDGKLFKIIIYMVGIYLLMI